MTPARDADYANLQRTIAELQVENERLRQLCADAADLVEDLIDHEPRENDQESILIRLHVAVGIPVRRKLIV